MLTSLTFECGADDTQSAPPTATPQPTLVPMQIRPTAALSPTPTATPHPSPRATSTSTAPLPTLADHSPRIPNDPDAGGKFNSKVLFALYFLTNYCLTGEELDAVDLLGSTDGVHELQCLMTEMGAR